ncbi:MAG: T9SS type A sorting domain-containing protein [Ignavibacteria bacterium]|nr:T9SS type A sorting domain-containing protein [Ignavibacteria bacterium]
MAVTTTATEFTPQAPIGLVWRDSLPNPYTKVFAYTLKNNNVNTEITNRAWHSIDIFTGINNNQNTVTEIPKEFSLSQNYPNPFNPSTRIEYAIPVEGKVTLKVFDLSGREVANLVNEVKAAGSYAVLFNGANIASGVYFYRINVQGDKKYESVKRMVLIK